MIMNTKNKPQPVEPLFEPDCLDEPSQPVQEKYNFTKMLVMGIAFALVFVLVAFIYKHHTPVLKENYIEQKEPLPESFTRISETFITPYQRIYIIKDSQTQQEYVLYYASTGASITPRLPNKE